MKLHLVKFELSLEEDNPDYNPLSLFNKTDVLAVQCDHNEEYNNIVTMRLLTDSFLFYYVSILNPLDLEI